MEISNGENINQQRNANPKRQIGVAYRRNPLRNLNAEEQHQVLKPIQNDKQPLAARRNLQVTKQVQQAPEQTKQQGLEKIRRPLQAPSHIRDIDAEDKNNPQLVSEYVMDIYNYLWELEERFPVRKDHLGFQTEINGKMRMVLVNWMVRIHQRFRMLQETLYMAVSLMDRFLQEKSVKKEKLQLVGVGAMYVAAKVEEMFAPELSDFVFITDNAYTNKDILRMELVLLRTLQFNLGRPLPLHFLRRNSKAGNVDQSMHLLAKYLVELTLVDYELASVRPSLIAAAALYISKHLLDHSGWTAELTYYSGHAEPAVRAVAAHICSLVLKAPQRHRQDELNNAVYTKYSNKKFLSVATIKELSDPFVKELASEAKPL